MLTLLGLDARTVVFHLEPGAVEFRPAADFDPAVTVARRVDHHVRHRALNGERVHTNLNFTGLKVSINFTLVAAFCRHHFTQHRVQVRHFHRHLLAGAQVVDELLDDGVALFDVLVDGLGEITVLFPHHLRRQTNTRQGGAQVMAHARHQQRTVIRKLLHACRHMVKRTRHRADFRGTILAQRRRNNAFTDLQRSVLQVDQRSVLYSNKQPGSAYRQQHNCQGIAEQRREIALMDFGQRDAHPDVG